jgi:hypothetical protein
LSKNSLSGKPFLKKRFSQTLSKKLLVHKRKVFEVGFGEKLFSKSFSPKKLQ